MGETAYFCGLRAARPRDGWRARCRKPKPTGEPADDCANTRTLVVRQGQLRRAVESGIAAQQSPGDDRLGRTFRIHMTRSP